MLPEVLIQLQNGTLGSVGETGDGISAMVLTGTGTVDIPLATPKVIFSLADAEALGITEDAQPAAYRQIKEFYQGYRYITGRSVAELYIMLLSESVTLTQMADVTTADGAKKLVDYSEGRVKLLGLTRKAPSGYTPDLSDGVDADSLAALVKAHDLGNAFAAKQASIRVLVEGRAFDNDNIGDLVSLKTMDYNRAGMVLFSTQEDESASVGLFLGIKAGLPVQRKASRVKNGSLPFTNLFVGGVEATEVTGIGAIHDKGYIAVRKFPTRAGYYITGEPMACADTDDYAILSRGLIIDKGQRIAYDQFLQELEDDVPVDENGQLQEGYKMYLENKVVTALSLQMVDAISAKPEFSIPEGQNILSTATTNVALGLTPVGYQSQINVKLGFQNPALT